MGWTHKLDIDSAASSAEDNPFAALKQQPVGKVSVSFPTGDLLCRKMDSLILTLVQGYLCRSSETGVLQREQFKPSKSHAKWYRLYPNKGRPAVSVSFWHCDSAKLNSAYSWMERSSRLTTPANGERRLQGNPLTSVTRQPESIGASVEFDRECSQS